MSDRMQHNILKEGLLAGDWEMVRRYQTNGEFHRGIDTLAAVLPIFVEALAKHSDEHEAKAQTLMKLMESAPQDPIFIPKEQSE